MGTQYFYLLVSNHIALKVTAPYFPCVHVKLVLNPVCYAAWHFFSAITFQEIVV